MTYAWCTWLLPALQTDPFVAARLLETDGWRTRGRPGGSFVPTGWVEHHTACMMRVGHDPQTDIAVNLAGNTVAPGPISQLLGTFTPPGVKWNGHNADPRIILIAAGRANHAGVSQFPWDPNGPGGNALSGGTEWCGPPVDEWPDVVIELRARVTACILRWNGWGVHQVTTHHECARPAGRKIDPSSAWSGEPKLTQLQPWNADLWRPHVGRYLTPAPPQVIDPPAVIDPTPTPTPDPTPPVIEPDQPAIDMEDDMIIVDYGQPGTDWWWTRCVIAGGTLCWVQGQAQQWTDPLTGVTHKLDELAGGRHIQVANDDHMVDLLATWKATSECPSTFALNARLTAAWQASLARTSARAA